MIFAGLLAACNKKNGAWDNLDRAIEAHEITEMGNAWMRPYVHQYKQYATVRHANTRRYLKASPPIAEAVAISMSFTDDTNAAIITMTFIDGRQYDLWLNKGLETRERTLSVQRSSGDTSPWPDSEHWPKRVDHELRDARVSGIDWVNSPWMDSSEGHAERLKEWEKTHGSDDQ